MNRSLLIVDDDLAVLDVVGRHFERRSWTVARASGAAEALRLFEDARPPLVILDLQLPVMSGLRLLEVLRARDAEVGIILLTGHGDIATAVEAMRLGAENFLGKPVEMAHLEQAAERAYEMADLRRRVRLLAERTGGTGEIDLGSSSALRELSRQATLLADSDSTVLLQGETGTGKGWLAQQIHAHSPRRRNPFVEVNCAGLSATFLDSELFGHERGAFTDAKTQKLGLFEVGNGGTLFLDEIADLALDLQPKLLKVLERRRFRRLGGTRELAVDVRVIAATNRDLAGAVAAGTFREDLFYRLSVFPLVLPPLRERGRTVVAELAVETLRDLRGTSELAPRTISAEAMRLLAGYAWPGNVRELRNVLERALLLARGAQEIGRQHLPADIAQRPAGLAVQDPSLSLEEVERRHIALVLESLHGSISAAARSLGVSRSTLYEKISRYGLRHPPMLAAR